MTHLEAVRDAVVMEPVAHSEDATVLAQSGVQHTPTSRVGWISDARTVHMCDRIMYNCNGSGNSIQTSIGDQHTENAQQTATRHKAGNRATFKGRFQEALRGQ